MTEIPSLQIIFAIFIMILPEGTTTFTVQRETDKYPIEFTLNEDKLWSVHDPSLFVQAAFLVHSEWKLEGMAVHAKAGEMGEAFTYDGPQKITTDISKWVTRTEKGFLVDKKVLKIAKVKDSEKWLLHTPNGIFEAPVTIELKNDS